MNTEEFINILRDLIRAYENRKRGNLEENMWRERYLDSLPKYEDPARAAKIWAGFLYIPSETFLEKSPEEWIKKLEKWNEDTKT
jgi:hypothetical protein